MLRWRKVAVVLRREYLTRIATKAFWISTLVVPVVIVAFTVVPSLLASRAGGRFSVALVCDDAGLVREIQQALARRQVSPSAMGGAVAIGLRVEAPAIDGAAQRTQLKRAILAKEINAAVFIRKSVFDDGKLEYVSTNVSAFRLMSVLERSIDAAVINLRLVRAGVPEEKVAALTRRVEMRATRVAEDLGESSHDATEQSFLLSYILSFLLYLTVMFYGYYVMRGVLEEKTSRIVEVIVGNVRPYELMLGKILGIGAVGLTQYAIWVLVVVNLALPGMLALAVGNGEVMLGSPWLLFYFVLFFVLGYFFWASVYAAVGSAFNTEEEAQQMQTIVGMVMAIPMIVMFPVIANPDSTPALIISLIPPFSPVLFFVRMSIQFPPAWQIILCLVLLVGSVFAVARFAGAVYRIGILMYGKRPTLGEIWRWVRTS